jgi:hypothetical protein
MSLLNYKNFLLNESIINESSTAGDELKKAFEDFKSGLSKDELSKLLAIAGAFTNPSTVAVLRNYAYVTIYPTIINILTHILI